MLSRVRSCVVGALVLWGCTDPNPWWDRGTAADPTTNDPAPSVSDDAAHPSGDAAVPDSPQVPRPVGVDVLLVVDNSPGMGPAQERLAGGIEAMLAALDRLPGGPDYRVGVVSTDLGVGIHANDACSEEGDAAALLVGADCNGAGLPQTGFVENVGGRRNVDSLEDALECMVQLGTKGCGFEQPLEAMRRALLAEGFLRPTAALAVMILSNEDDCSAANPNIYDAFDYDLGPYSSYRCFRYGVLCDGEQPPLARAVMRNCLPGQSHLHPVDERYAGVLRQLRPPSWVSVQVLAGPVPDEIKIAPSVAAPPGWKLKPGCSDDDIRGDPAVRLAAFARAVGPQASISGICRGSYREPIEVWLERLTPAFQ
jgi:hypothetical protein